VTRTLDLRIRNPLLYPAELRAQFIGLLLTATEKIIEWFKMRHKRHIRLASQFWPSV
jgi:hypothetical protein